MADHDSEVTFYKKVGRKYVAVSKWERDLTDSLPFGHHLISVGNGMKSTRININPDKARLLAARIMTERELPSVLREASKYTASVMSETSRHAWNEFVKTLPENQLYSVTSPSAHDVVSKMLDYMLSKTERDLIDNNAVVQEAWDNFRAVCIMCADNPDKLDE